MAIQLLLVLLLEAKDNLDGTGSYTDLTGVCYHDTGGIPGRERMHQDQKIIRKKPIESYSKI